MTPTKKLQWGILGAGHIAREFADGVIGSRTGELLAVGSRTQENAEKLGDEFAIARRYGSYDALLADPEVEAVYIATPHPMHAEWTVKAAEAGKHILVEKPIGMNWFEAMAMIDAARVHDVFLMEAFMYRCHPQMARVREMITDGTLGHIRLIQAAFSYDAGEPADNRAFLQELGGGGILDVGCYPISASRFIAGTALGLPFVEPIDLKGCGHLGVTGIDEWAIVALRFPGDIVAQCSTGIHFNQHHDNHVTIFGTRAKLTLLDPWIPSRYNRDPVKMLLHVHGSDPEELLLEAPEDLYSYEADMVGDHIAARQAPAMTWDDTLGNMRALDRWRAEVGLVYDLEKPENYVHTIAHRPLTVRQPSMKYGRIAGLDKPVSRLVMGCDSNHGMPDTAILFDAYFEAGGNTFDTSHGYGIPNGACERNLGWWVRNRGIRDQVVIQEKGANAPNDSPAGLVGELEHGLERLQMEGVDIYMIHRDNEAVPIGEWVEVLNEQRNAGRMKIFGLSNFSVPRLIAFQEYAAAHGLQSFSAVSNQFSLAQVLAPIWDMHLVSSSDDASRRWFIATQTPLLPWSSQARGFFTDRAGREKFDDAEVVRCWYNEENFARKERAEALARERGVEPINIALAYVLNQPFPTFPLVGPKQISELRSCLRALEVELSPEELGQLWNGASV